MAAYEWQDEGRIEIDDALSRQLDLMIHRSSNRATQRVVRTLTDTEPGPALDDEDYAAFYERRHRIKVWLESMGIEELHAVHPTYDGGDIHGRDLQFLQDPSVPGCLPNQTGEYRNRLAMTSNATAELLALLALDRALSPASSKEVRERMRRDPRQQPYLWKRIAGGADLRDDLEIFSKTGTWGRSTPMLGSSGRRRRAISSSSPSSSRASRPIAVTSSRRSRGKAIQHLMPRESGKQAKANRRIEPNARVRSAPPHSSRKSFRSTS